MEEFKHPASNSMRFSFFVLGPFKNIFICSVNIASTDRAIMKYSPWRTQISKYFIQVSYSINNSNAGCGKECKIVPVLN
jgi:hypothetical protein